MRSIKIILFLISATVFAQESIEAEFLKTKALNAETLISIDNFGSAYYVTNNVFHKKDDSKTITFSNLQLGDLFTVDTFNPLKINLFYKDFNTVIILDNRLAEIFKIDFNQITPYKNVSQISAGYDNTIWIFNQDLQKLELFDYKTKSSRAQTVPVQSAVLDLKSNYNYCWLLTENYLYMYNYFGSLIKKMKNTGFTSFAESNENIILKKENTLFYMKKNSEQLTPIKTGNLLINDFFVTNETLYIYTNKSIQEFKLKTN
ncbi:hypothetical protein Q4566_02840 [Tamlana sp. 2_MG-2023]|uniref:hypothetical protein n=1 Tax=unclassified Tamlana TaxID=2614803 RepID=UPI0026E1287C|nr:MULTISPECIES: hypothetical protein [unclassified Tamlana]MDO6759125.1 hypothetical protein [Tamlana sp. 2_MG-2023]MDO6789824.1 hypothetical protein [Tamlana sp. 1_MG-2023]